MGKKHYFSFLLVCNHHSGSVSPTIVLAHVSCILKSLPVIAKFNMRRCEWYRLVYCIVMH